MQPTLNIKIFNKVILTFHFYGVLGYTVGTILGMFLAMQLNLLLSVVLILAGIGAVTFFALAFFSKWLLGWENIVYYHHEISIMLLCTLTLYLLQLPILQYLDITLIGIGTFLAFGRIGCYSVGCCHGKPHKHGVTYGQQHVDAGFTWFYKDIPLLPVQLIESAYVFLTVIVSAFLLFTHTLPGTVLIVYTVVYGSMRYTLEFFRGDPERPLFLGLSEAQWTTLALTGITFGISKMNWLPAYDWHGLILLAMIAASICTLYYFKRYPDHNLFKPQHVQQLASGLNELTTANENPELGKQERINLYTTNAGLSVSCSNNQEVNGVKHYTISMKNKRKIARKSADKIAKLIGILMNHPDPYELIEKQNGIYHILYNKTGQ